MGWVNSTKENMSAGSSAVFYQKSEKRPHSWAAYSDELWLCSRTFLDTGASFLMVGGKAVKGRLFGVRSRVLL